MRSHVQYYEEGEKPSKFFCNLEKRNYINKMITKVNINENEMRKYCKNLYNSKLSDNSIVGCLLKNSNIKQLTEVDQSICEGLLNENEI